MYRNVNSYGKAYFATLYGMWRHMQTCLFVNFQQDGSASGDFRNKCSKQTSRPDKLIKPF